MRSLSKLFLVISLTHSSLVAAECATAAPRAERETDGAVFYDVPLMCPAARGLGCGSRAKPVLLELEKAPTVEQAWLDHTGQILAVIWNEDSAAAERAATLAAISKAHVVPMEELSGDARADALQSFRGGDGWLRGADVDRLSEQEARVITDRLLARLVTQAPTAKAKVESLRPVVTDTTRGMLLDMGPSRSEYPQKLLAAAREHLNEQEVSAFRDAIALGLRPVGGEQ